MFRNVIKKLTNRPTESNKYDYGHVLVLGGSPGMVGAPFLCTLGASRTGAGLVSIASAVDVIDKLEKRVLEIMTLRLAGDIAEQVRVLSEFISNRRVSVLVAGPGFDPSHVEVLKQVLKIIEIPMVLDAGALTCYGDDLDSFKSITSKNLQIVGTPHLGELQKFSGREISGVIKERTEQVKSIAHDYGFTLVCKGVDTLVASPNGELYRNETGDSGLATAGTGDVLAGVIGGLIAQGFSVEESCQVGVYLHGLAVELASVEKTQPGMIASDVVEFIPKAIKNCLNEV